MHRLTAAVSEKEAGVAGSLSRPDLMSGSCPNRVGFGQAGVNVDQSSTKVVTRAQAAKDKRAAQAGVIDPDTEGRRETW